MSMPTRLDLAAETTPLAHLFIVCLLTFSSSFVESEILLILPELPKVPFINIELNIATQKDGSNDYKKL